MAPSIAGSWDLASLGLAPFRPRAPWWTGDLQTVRDTLMPVALPPERGQPLAVPVGGGDRLLTLLDAPLRSDPPLGLVVVLHGLGGSSGREGVRRMGWALQQAGFAVLRVNMRGAGPGRHLARGTYSAQCTRDLLPVLQRARRLAARRPLLGMGLSLGGTKLLNALLAPAPAPAPAPGPVSVPAIAPAPLLDGLVCISSPLDLEACSRQIDRPRNRLYQRWLLQRLVAQTLADPFGVSEQERAALAGRGPVGPIRSIRAFDAAITAPRWGYGSVEQYYAEASPLGPLLAGPADRLPPLLLVHALDDPWVPVAPAQQLATAAAKGESPIQVLITSRGGHNGFHAVDDGPDGNWGDRLTARWMRWLVGQRAQVRAE